MGAKIAMAEEIQQPEAELSEVQRLLRSGDEAGARALMRRQRIRSTQAERKRAAQLNAPTIVPQFDGVVQKLLKDLAIEMDKARAARAEADRARTLKLHQAHRAAVGRERAALDQARRLRRRIDDERTAQLDRRWVESAKGETDLLATTRGEPLIDDRTDVPDWVREEDGSLARGEDGLPVLRTERAKVRRNFDPVLSLGRPGKPGQRAHLNEDQLDTAIKLRDSYASRKSDLGAVDPSAKTSGQRNHEAFVAGRFTAAQAMANVHRAEMAILMGSCRDERGVREIVAAEAFREPGAANRHQALRILRAVCSEGLSLSSQGKGSTFEANLIALKMALNVAHEVMKGRPKAKLAA